MILLGNQIFISDFAILFLNVSLPLVVVMRLCASYAFIECAIG